MDAVPARSTGRGRFLAGDALRGFAATTLVVYHVWSDVRNGFAGRGDTGAFTAFGSLEWWIGHLDIALYVFFVLSGYLISRPFLAAIINDESLPSIPRYARNRFLRIVPAFVVCWTLILIIWGTHGGGIVDIAGVYLLLQDYVDQAVSIPQLVQGWTVGVEAMFYIAVPVGAIALTWLIRRFRLPAWRTLMVFLVLGAVGGLAIRAANTTGYRYVHSFPAIAFAFVPGMFLACIEIRYADGWSGAAWGPKAAWGLVATAAALFVAFVIQKPTGLMANSLYAAITAFVMVAAPLVLQWTTERNWILFSNRFSVWLGARSYAIYLYHVAVLFAFDSIVFRQSSVRVGALVGLVLTLAGTFLVAELSFRFVEQPALRLRTGPPHQAAEAEAVLHGASIAEAEAFLATHQDPGEGRGEGNLAESQRGS